MYSLWVMYKASFTITKWNILFSIRYVSLFFCKTNRFAPKLHKRFVYIMKTTLVVRGGGRSNCIKYVYPWYNFLGHKRIPGLQRWRPWPSQFYERTHARRGCSHQGWGAACPGARWGAGSRSAQCSTRIFLPWICTNGDNYWMSLKFSPISTFYLLLYVQEILTYFI